MNILSIFSGRKNNIMVLKKYLEKALELNIIQEVHFWNNTRTKFDENYIKTISNLRRTSSTGSGNYILINPVIYDNSFVLKIKAKNDIHIKLTNNALQLEYEIVLGGWNNTKSVIRENNEEIYSLERNDICDEKKHCNFEIKIDNNNVLLIKKNDELLLSKEINKHFKLDEIYFKTGYKSVADLLYNPTQNAGFYFMDTCEKTWKNYYNYYVDETFKNDIILKCDDDIVFIDLRKLPKFIEFVKNNDYDLVFANTINNGVSAYYQQNKYKLIPQTLMNLEYPPGGLCGSLWESGIKAEHLHNYFINNYRNFIDFPYDNEVIPIPTRFSINFFGYKGKNWHKIKDCFIDDEYNLTVEYVKTRDFKNVLYTDFYVSHLSFYKQNQTGINEEDLIKKYDNLCKTIMDNKYFLMNE